MLSVSALLLILATSPHLEEGRALVQQLKFDKARAPLEAAKASTTLTVAERREVSQLLAHCAAAEGRLAEADAVYAELLAQDPRAPAPVTGPPRLRDAFRRAKERLYPPTYVSLTRTPAAVGRVGVQLIDPWARCTGAVRLHRRELEGGPFTQMPLPMDEAGQAHGPLDAATAWFIDAVSPEGEVCAALGSAAQPFLVAAPPVPLAVTIARVDAPPPVRPRWVPWVAVSLTAAAALTAGLFVGLGERSLADARGAQFASDLRRFELDARAQFTWAWGFGIGAGVAAVVSAALLFAW